MVMPLELMSVESAAVALPPVPEIEAFTVTGEALHEATPLRVDRLTTGVSHVSGTFLSDVSGQHKAVKTEVCASAQRGRKPSRRILRGHPDRGGLAC
jgi:hypothetical protein